MSDMSDDNDDASVKDNVAPSLTGNGELQFVDADDDEDDDDDDDEDRNTTPVYCFPHLCGHDEKKP